MKQKKLKDSAAEFERRLKKTGKEKYVLRLYVAGMTTKSKRAIQSVKQICDEHLKDRCDLEVIDVFRQPVLAKGRADHRYAYAAQKTARTVTETHRGHDRNRTDSRGLDLRPKD